MAEEEATEEEGDIEAGGAGDCDCFAQLLLLYFQRRRFLWQDSEYPMLFSLPWLLLP